MMAARERLNRYLNDMRGKPFSWGQHDCLTFTNDAFHAMYGRGWADDWLGRYMEGNRVFSRKELIKEFGYSDFTKAVDKKLQRVDNIPPLGALVTTKESQRWIIGVAMGICTGTKAVFLSKEGLLFLPVGYIHQAWVKET
jgi:hypothetical protein